MQNGAFKKAMDGRRRDLCSFQTGFSFSIAEKLCKRHVFSISEAMKESIISETGRNRHSLEFVGNFFPNAFPQKNHISLSIVKIIS